MSTTAEAYSVLSELSSHSAILSCEHSRAISLLWLLATFLLQSSCHSLHVAQLAILVVAFDSMFVTVGLVEN